MHCEHKFFASFKEIRLIPFGVSGVRLDVAGIFKGDWLACATRCQTRTAPVVPIYKRLKKNDFSAGPVGEHH